MLVFPHGFERCVWLDTCAAFPALDGRPYVQSIPNAPDWPSLVVVEADGSVWFWDGYLLEG